MTYINWESNNDFRHAIINFFTQKANLKWDLAERIRIISITRVKLTGGQPPSAAKSINKL